ncbi:MAG: TIGR01777 family oxidoreductase [Acidiferrobacterales bacterium]
MFILVSGGSGFIGRALCTRLINEGHRVMVLTRDRGRTRLVLSDKVATIESLGEITGKSAPQAIVNLAGLSLGSGRWNDALKQEFIASRVDVTRALVNHISVLPQKPRVMVSGSAVGYYGARGDELLDETAAPGNEYQSDLCKAWEAEALKAQSQGVRVCIFRSGVVLGAGGGALSSLLPAFRLGLGGYVGSGRQWMSWIHMADLLGIILFLTASESLSGAFNSTAPNPETNRNFARTLGGVMHRPSIMQAPGWLVRLGVGEMAHLYLTGQKVIPKRLLDAGYKFQYPELRAALEDVLS